MIKVCVCVYVKEEAANFQFFNDTTKRCSINIMGTYNIDEKEMCRRFLVSTKFNNIKFKK